MSNVILIGMPSCGKTTVGRKLAELLGYRFLDCDDLIRESEGKTLPELIEELGAEGFLAAEERVLAGICAERCVIATGGSAVYSRRAMEHLASIGKIVYLELPVGEIVRRIPNFAARGVVMRGNVSTLEELYRERVPLYRKYAELTVARTGLSRDSTAERIVRELTDGGYL